jgi:hypothetical protein
MTLGFCPRLIFRSAPANEPLAQHLWAHCDGLFTFLRQPGVGRDYLIGLARRLAKLDLRSVLG